MDLNKASKRFINKSIRKYGKDVFDYSLVNYINHKTPVKLRCIKHNLIFEQTPTKHLRIDTINSCPMCHKEYKKMEQQTRFIEECAEIFNNKFDYSLVDYVDPFSSVEIICPIHGVFSIIANDHKHSKFGCPQCAYEHISKLRKEQSCKITLEDFINECNKIHSHKYDYSKVEFNKLSDNIDIICPKHGLFSQNAGSHLRGSGCPTCFRESQKKTNDQFIKDAINIFKDEYDYSKVIYQDAHTPVCVICHKTDNGVEHGEFWVKPNSHLSSHSGCPICNSSKGERIIRNLLLENNIKFQREYAVECPSEIRIKNKVYVDFYLPDLNVFIEYNGEQHYNPDTYYNITDSRGIDYVQRKDLYIKEYCQNNNIKLIEIRFDEDIKEKLKQSNIINI